jgi:hypothetical protein
MPWRWAHDEWWAGDKLGHFLGGLVSPLLLWAAFGLWRGWCVLFSLAFWWLWEVKDAILRWEDAGWLGGDGFSWRDGLVSTAGVFFAWMILELFGSCLPGA